jgi:uncharacterized protein YndB with AHSA1/START domain
MKRLVLFGVLTVLAVVTIVAGVGAALPVQHTARGQVTLAAPPERVFAVISDVRGDPVWRSNVSKVEILSESPLRWREHDGSDSITFEVIESSAPTGRRVRIADPDLPFGGTWTYAVTPEGTGTRLEITEHGEVYNPVFRFVSRFVIGHTATIDGYLGDLRRHLGN